MAYKFPITQWKVPSRTHVGPAIANAFLIVQITGFGCGFTVQYLPKADSRGQVQKEKPQFRYSQSTCFQATVRYHVYLQHTAMTLSPCVPLEVPL